MFEIVMLSYWKLLCYKLMLYIPNVTDNSGHVDVIHTYLSKDFDSLDHGIFLKNFSSFGRNFRIILYFQSYLGNRRLMFQHCIFQSVEVTAKSSVPQRSSWGLLLLIDFINDI